MSHLPWRTRAFTAVYDRLGHRPVSALGLDEIRRRRAVVAPTRWPFTLVTGRVPTGVRIDEVAFTARDGRQIPVRRYRPSLSGPHAVVVFLHGGGWVLGDPRGYDPMCGLLAAEVPAVVLSIDYRRAPEHVAPQAVLDCVDALRWAATEPPGDIDPSRLAVCGDSAGGNLAAVACQVVRDEGGPAISHQALLYPGTDATQSYPSVREHAGAPMLSRQHMDAYLELYVGRSGLRRDDPLVSPVLARDLSGLPPALVQTADLDPLRDEGIAYAQRLEVSGVPVRATNYLGAPHGFLSIPGVAPCAAQAQLELVTEVARHLGTRPVVPPGHSARLR